MNSGRFDAKRRERSRAKVAGRDGAALGSADRRRWHLLCVSALGLLVGRPASAQTRKWRIALFSGAQSSPSFMRNVADPFRDGLREAGYVEGQNVELHFRWADGQPERLPRLAAELLQLTPDVLVAIGPGPAQAAKAATTQVPVVALAVDDPVETGLIADFARPGGNLTGISSFGGELVAKRLQLIKELVPAMRRVAVLMNPATAKRPDLEPAVARFGRPLGLQTQVVEAATPEQFDAAFDDMVRQRAEGVLVLGDATFFTHRARLHELVAKHRLPSVWGGRDYLPPNGLASYQSDFPAIFKRGAAMVDRILKGAKPAVTPFEQATKLELVINLKAAQAMGLAVPQSLLLAADEVIR
ncbi:MAG: ABC transporter substrate-binding protein [Caldimonas sp.]